MDEGRPVSLGGMKQRTLLGLLLLHANDVVSRDRLTDELWDGAPPDTAATALQVHVSQLRKALGRDTIATRSPGYVLVVDPASVDAERFDELVKRARQEAPAAAARTLREALSLWRGPPLGDLDDAVARIERAQLEEQRAAAVEQRIAADLELGAHVELVPELEALVRREPLRERRRAQLMLALYRSGRQADALEVYREGRRLLADELGLDPGEELRQLERAILEHDPSLDAPARPRQPVEVRVGSLVTRARWAVAVGALLLAGALAFVLVLLTRESGPASVAVLGDSVAVVDPATGRVEADIAIGGRPTGIAFGAGSAWIVNSDDQTVLRVDPRTYRVLKTIGGLGTDLSAIAYGFGSIWVAGGNDGTVVRIDPNLNAAGAPIDLGRSDAVLPQPVFLVTTGAGSVWATRGNQILRIDPATNEVADTARQKQVTGLTAASGRVWAIRLDEQLLRFDSGTLAPTASRDLSVQANFPVEHAGSLCLIEYSEPPQVARLDPTTLAPLGSTLLPRGFPFGVASGDGALWTTDHDHGTLFRIDDRTQVASLVARLGHHPVAVAEGEGAVWVGVQAKPFS